MATIIVNISILGFFIGLSLIIFSIICIASIEFTKDEEKILGKFSLVDSSFKLGLPVSLVSIVLVLALV